MKVPSGYSMRDVQFEMSLKPFFDTTPATRDCVIREIFEQWRALTRHAESISIMFWIGDGSEILEYDRNMKVPFEWGRYQGSASGHNWNPPKNPNADDDSDKSGIGTNAWSDKHDPKKIGLHRHAYLYRDNPPEFTFTWLCDTVTAFKRIGKEMTGKKIFVGETFDIGPEFAVSRFKYQWHPEILSGGNSYFAGQFISCEGVLHGDKRNYAAYPQGIPEGTPFGTFLGKQLNCFFKDMGFDFLWLSNGFGFALDTWTLRGNLFDGEKFTPEAADGVKERIIGFWKNLRKDFPNKYHIRTRGTNLCTGIDLGSDASPLRDIYRGDFAMDAPVNCPWAALDGDFGLELSGWMTHIAQHPGETFRFRYYIHDPWWKNSPYLDRYERNPHDIFLPSAISRVQSDGSVEIARDIAFLSIDDSDGLMPLAVPNEVTAHLLRAREFAPDEAGPLVWAYPFDAFHDLVQKDKQPQIPFASDLFIGTAINDSLPLNTVADIADLPAVMKKQPKWTTGRIIASPVPRCGSAEEKTLLAILNRGGDVLLYGALPAASPFRKPLGIELSEAIEGDFALDLRHSPAGENLKTVGKTVRHTGMLSAGGIAETPAKSLPTGTKHLALLKRGKNTRVAAAFAAPSKGGKLAWVRGSVATNELNPENPKPIQGPILHTLNAKKFFPLGRLMRFSLDALGWCVSVQDMASSNRPPYLTIHRHNKALFLSGYHLDENAKMRVRIPLGAPLLTFRTTAVVDGATEITGTRAWSHEARVFVESGGDGLYRAQFISPIGYQVYRRMMVSGCKNATLNFLVDPSSDRPIRILRKPFFPFLVGDFVKPIIKQTPLGKVIRIENVEGDLLIEW